MDGNAGRVRCWSRERVLRCALDRQLGFSCDGGVGPVALSGHSAGRAPSGDARWTRSWSASRRRASDQTCSAAISANRHQSRLGRSRKPAASSSPSDPHDALGVRESPRRAFSSRTARPSGHTVRPRSRLWFRMSRTPCLRLAPALFLAGNCNLRHRLRHRAWSRMPAREARRRPYPRSQTQAARGRDCPHAVGSHDERVHRRQDDALRLVRHTTAIALTQLKLNTGLDTSSFGSPHPPESPS